MPHKANPAPASINAPLPYLGPKPLCCKETAQNIDTEIGGAMMKGISKQELHTIILLNVCNTMLAEKETSEEITS